MEGGRAGGRRWGGSIDVSGERVLCLLSAVCCRALQLGGSFWSWLSQSYASVICIISCASVPPADFRVTR